MGYLNIVGNLTYICTWPNFYHNGNTYLELTLLNDKNLNVIILSQGRIHLKKRTYSTLILENVYLLFTPNIIYFFLSVVMKSHIGFLE